MASSSIGICIACSKPLTLQLEPEDDEADTMGDEDTTEVDDDLELQCSCHFHWQCLLDSYSVTECPNCQKDLTSTSATGEQQILCNLKNEGGLQQGLDILPILTEEAYLKTFPEERKCQAFLEFCGEGDMEAIVDMLNEEEDEVGTSGGDTYVLGYQDQIRTMNSGLHVAIQNQRHDVAWLLLFLASRLDLSNFPSEVLNAARSFGIQRGLRDDKVDIRTLQDADGYTAEQRAAAMSGIWEEWVRSGRLRPPE